MGISKKLAVIGDPISHSKSPVMQQAAIRALKLSATYQALLIPTGKISQIKKYQKEGFTGFNITIPHKQAVVPYCDRLTPTAKAVGAVNTFYKSGNIWKGENTDVQGFINALKEVRPIQKSQTVLVFGAGGASLAIVYAFLKLKVKKIYLCNRTGSRAMRIKKLFKSARIEVIAWNSQTIQECMASVDWVVNTTALGLGKLKKFSPLPAGVLFRKNQVAIDLVYTSQPTPFLKQAQKAGAKTQNGLPMLLHQGALSFQIFLKKKPPLSEMRKALKI